MKVKKKLVIIGGGAAGFFCAANINPELYSIVILEQNQEVLQKLKISGGGRCNLTHAGSQPSELVQFYPRGRKELLSVFQKFDQKDTMLWFETRKIPLKIEADGRVFPNSNQSQSIIECLLQECQQNNVEILTQHSVKLIEKREKGYHICTNKTELCADIIVFCTGSSPKSYKILQDLGHHIITPVPSLFTFNCTDPLIENLAGTSFEQVALQIPELKLKEQGPLLFTHWGLSGPAILKISSWKARELFERNYQFEIVLNFINEKRPQAEALIKNYKEKNPKESLGSGKIFFFSKRFWHRILHLLQIDANKTYAQLSNKEIQQILDIICQYKMTVSGKSVFKDEFVTAGGVDLKEIDFKNMASKHLDHFYLAGEVLNIDALTGGFNFQACWSEGWLIAQALNAKYS